MVSLKIRFNTPADSQTSKSTLNYIIRSISPLDTYPYNGTTTTFEALLMGRPVITLRGNTHVSSVGNSILTTLGFTEFIALSPAEYINKAVSLSQDISKLQDYHSSISQKMLESKLCDSKLFYKKFIEAIEKIMIIA